ncbi:hypothetical protein N7540_005634 [Penicillium herquei]|nr:hypothetical protein N7540_005634 [Penicillium herquei]
MSSKLPTEFPIYPFPSTEEFELFLEREHTNIKGFYLKLAKKASGIPSISASEAVEIALCFGWIDGRANGLDKDWWLVRYTPRRPKSIWSQKNVYTVNKLIETGRMRPIGLAAVEAAKADGRWERAYAGPATIIVPDDFRTALTASPEAGTFFETLNKTDRYSVLLRIQTASVKSREKRIETLVQQLAQKKHPNSLASGRKRQKDRMDDGLDQSTKSSVAKRTRR